MSPTTVAASSNALRVYRRLLGLAKQLPQEKRASALQQIREGFREHATETDVERAKGLLEKASSTLGYLKMITPRRVLDKNSKQDDSVSTQDSDGRTYAVYKDGEGKIEGEALQRERAAYSNWDGNNLDPDSVRRHQHQLKRAGFRDNLHAKGGIF